MSRNFLMLSIGKGPVVSIRGAGIHHVQRMLQPYVMEYQDKKPVLDIELVSGECFSVEGLGGRRIRLHQEAEGILYEGVESSLVLPTGQVGNHYHITHGIPGNMRICIGRAEGLLDAFQVIRGALVGACVNAGMKLLHGAIMIRGGKGVLLLGPKGSGKTSFLLAALRRFKDAGFVTNDKALVDEGTMTVYGLPYALTIADGTLVDHPRLSGIPFRRSNGKLLVWPRDAGQELGFPIRSTATLAEVWRCRIDLSVDRSTVTTSQPDDGAVGAAQQFSHAMSPTWLYRFLGWDYESVVGEEYIRSLPWRELYGNPSATWEVDEKDLSFSGHQFDLTES